MKPRSCERSLRLDYHLTLKMASVQVVETSVPNVNNSPSQDSTFSIKVNDSRWRNDRFPTNTDGMSFINASTKIN